MNTGLGKPTWYPMETGATATPFFFLVAFCLPCDYLPLPTEAGRETVTMEEEAFAFFPFAINGITRQIE
jgi:hypothetical protein